MDAEMYVRNLVLSVCDFKLKGSPLSASSSCVCKDEDDYPSSSSLSNTPVPIGRVGSQLWVSHANSTHLLLHGGADANQCYDDLFSIELERGVCKEILCDGFSKPSPRYGHSLTKFSNKCILFGGFTANESNEMKSQTEEIRGPPFMKGKNWYHKTYPSNELFCLQTSTFTWIEYQIKGTPPSPRGFHSASMWKNFLVIFGGATDASMETYTNEMYLFDLVNDEWIEGFYDEEKQKQDLKQKQSMDRRHMSASSRKKETITPRQSQGREDNPIAGSKTLRDNTDAKNEDDDDDDDKSQLENKKRNVFVDDRDKNEKENENANRKVDRHTTMNEKMMGNDCKQHDDKNNHGDGDDKNNHEDNKNNHEDDKNNHEDGDDDKNNHEDGDDDKTNHEDGDDDKTNHDDADHIQKQHDGSDDTKVDDDNKNDDIKKKKKSNKYDVDKQNEKNESKTSTTCSLKSVTENREDTTETYDDDDRHQHHEEDYYQSIQIHGNKKQQKQTNRYAIIKGMIPAPRYGHSMTTIDSSGIILMTGGAEGDPFIYSLEFDDNSSSSDENIILTWSIVETSHTYPLSRRFFCFGCCRNRVFVYGGICIGNEQVPADLYVLNLTNRIWTKPLYDGKTNLRCATSTTFHDKLLVFGGVSANPVYSVSLNAAEEPNVMYKFSKTLFFLHVLELKNGSGDGLYRFKVVMIGDSGVGKSSLLLRFVSDQYSDFYVSTIGVDFRSLQTMIKGKVCTLQLWDTAGQERYKGITANYIRKADAFILVFDVTRLDTFYNLNLWIQHIKEHHECGDDVCFLLLENKIDEGKKNIKIQNEIMRFAEQLNAIYIPTSAKTSENVDLAFLALAGRLYETRKKENELKLRSMTSPSLSTMQETHQSIRLDHNHDNPTNRFSLSRCQGSSCYTSLNRALNVDATASYDRNIVDPHSHAEGE